jgi:hypothetical protein
MGLAVSVGTPAIGDAEGEEHVRQQYLRLSEVLAARGVPWSLPADPAQPASGRRHVSSFPYSSLHHLRRAYALRFEGRPVTPVIDGDLSDADRYVTDASSMLSSHLLCHSDNAGYYVPIILDDPVFLSRDSGIAGGGMVGSSYGLLDELKRIAPDIGVRLEEDGTLSDGEAQRLFTNSADPYGTEQMVWLTLHEACRASIESGQPIIFH